MAEVVDMKSKRPKDVTDATIKRVAKALHNFSSEEATQRGERSAYLKECEEQGIHKGAMKLAVKLKGWSSEKRADYLRGLDRYREVLELDVQGDMLDEAAE